MSLLKSFGTLIVLLVVAFSVDAVTVALKPGKLPGFVKDMAIQRPAELKLTGVATSLDLASLRYLPSSVETVDMSGLQVEGIILSDSKYMGRTEFSDGELPPYAFFATNVKSVELPTDLIKIGEAAFAATPLISIKLPISLSYIGARAFYRCESLVSIDLSYTSVKEIPEQCFFGCQALKKVELPLTVTMVDNRAFMKSGLEVLDLSGVRIVGDYALAAMSALKEVTVRNGAEIGEGTFFNCSFLEKFNGVYSNSPALAVANSRISAAGGLIKGETIGEGAYANIMADTIVIDASVRVIEANAFRNMLALGAVSVAGRGDDVPVCSVEAFSGVDVGKVSLIVDKDTEKVWREAPVWQDFNIKASVSGVDNIEDKKVKIDICLLPNGDLEVRSDRLIEEVALYSLDGILLHLSEPDTYVCTAGPFAEKTIMARVTAGGISKIVKIMK